MNVADCHNDLLLELAFREFQLGEDNPFREHWLSQLEAGGVSLQVCAASAMGALVPDGALRDVLTQAVAFEHAVRDNPDRVLAVRSRHDLDRVASGDRLGLLLAMEGAEALGRDPWLVDTFWDLGLRMLSLTWEYRNFFADGTGEPEPDGGLSRLGRVLVERLDERGVVIDLAHASERTFWDVLECAPEAHVLVSHAACRALEAMPRNVSDEQLEALAARGGVFCLMGLGFAVGGEGSFARIAEHLEHALEVMGPGHVGLGVDFFEQLGTLLPLPAPLDGLFHIEVDDVTGPGDLRGPADYPALVDALRDRGWPEAAIESVAHRALLDFLARALPGRVGTPALELDRSTTGGSEEAS
jgi:membrane dipeptidase